MSIPQTTVPQATATKTPDDAQAAQSRKPTLTADQALGSCYQVPWRGRMLKISPFTEGVKADYIAHLKSVARAEVFALKNLMPPNEWQECFREYMRQLSTGAFNWLGEICVANMQSPEGMANILALMLAYAGESGLTQNTLLEMINESEISSIVSQALTDSLPKVKAPDKPALVPMSESPAEPPTT